MKTELMEDLICISPVKAEPLWELEKFTEGDYEDFYWVDAKTIANLKAME